MIKYKGEEVELSEVVKRLIGENLMIMYLTWEENSDIEIADNSFEDTSNMDELILKRIKQIKDFLNSI